jgi:hypothetical protein
VRFSKVFVAKFINFLRNPYSVRQVLNTRRKFVCRPAHHKECRASAAHGCSTSGQQSPSGSVVIEVAQCALDRDPGHFAKTIIREIL